jgi:hypothetical protein
MSDLLNSASLVVIPSGYKEDTVYSVVPSDGSGDLSFTRASNGTRVNSAGLVEVCPWNLLQYSEEFDNGVWSKYQASVTANTTTAPNGTLTADTLQDNTANDSHITYQTPNITAGTYTISVYAKASTLSNINLVLFDGVSISYGSNRFDLSNGTTTGANQSIENVGNGWYRCSFTLTTTLSGTQFVYVFLNNGTSSVYTGTGSGAVFIWGYQLNIGSTAKPYFPTTDRLNVPRLTYQNGGGGCPSLLLEKQSTNLVTYSEDFTQWSVGNLSVTANNTTSPDGTQNADLLTADGANIQHFVQNGVAQSNKTYSVFAKMGTQRYIQILTSGTAAPVANFDLQDGVANMIGSNSVASIQNYGNGWYRCILQTNDVLAGDFYVNYASSLTMGRFGATTTSNTLYIWGGQAESGSYPTSYIPTTSSSATRVADLSTSDTIQTAQTFAGDFTIFADFVPFIDSTDGNGLMILGGGASGLGATYQSYLWFVGSNVYLSGDGEVNIIQRSYSMVVNQRVKIAFTRVGTTVKMFVNGAQVGASNTSSLSITIRSIGWSYNLPTYQTKGKINQVVLSATGFSDADCQSLTTI